MSEDAKPVPTITLRMTDPDTFNIEISFETPNKEYARMMLLSAVGVIEKLQRDDEALQFGSQMARAAAAHNAMQKGPRRII
jgi:hypothetical protein